MRVCVLILMVVLPVMPAAAQMLTPAPPRAREVRLAGPRVGLTALSDGVVRELAGRGLEVGTTISQFGWQFEHQFYGAPGTIAALNELVVLVGGLEEGLQLPSASWLVGLRTSSGTEFGLGPNFSLAGVSMAFAAGVTLRRGVLNVPINVAVVPSRAGTRISVLTGFSLRQ